MLSPSCALLALLALACGRGGAERAVNAAGAALEGARSDVETYAPVEWKRLSGSLAAARSAFDRGDYDRALGSARELLPKIEAAAGAARRKREELMAAFGELKGGLPVTVAALKNRLGRLAQMTTLPAGLDQATVETAQANLDAAGQAWADALARFDAGDVIAAVDQANEVKTEVEELAEAFLPARKAK